MSAYLKPSAYLYILFFFFLLYLYREGYFQNIFSSSRQLIVVHFRKLLVCFLFLITLIVFFDQGVALFMKSGRFLWADKITSAANILGKGDLFIYPFAVICFFIFRILKNKYYTKLFAVSAASAVFAGIFIQVIKIIFARARPRISDSHLSFFNYKQIFDFENLANSDFLSFASGDVITITALIVPMIYFIRNKFMRAVFTFPILIVCFGRLYSAAHWLSDVFTGLVLGVFIGFVFCKKKILLKRILEIDAD